MANKNLFRNHTPAPKTNTVNKAGGTAYKLEDRAALAQMAMTCCFGNTYYSNPKTQLDEVMKLAQRICTDPNGTGTQFIGKLAIHARTQGFMKDMPAFLMSILAFQDPNLYEQIFTRVMDNAKMIRNHVQIVRSGALCGRKSMPGAMRRQLKLWFQNRYDDRLFRDTVGNDPSIADIIKMVHPKPRDAQQNALFGYILGRKYIKRDLPQLVKDYETFKRSPAFYDVPKVPFQMVSNLISDNQWTKVAKDAGWTMTRMNLNTFQRHGVFNDKKMVKMIADRIQDKVEIEKAMAFPYQLMAAWMYATDVPHEISEALQEAMEIATNNIPNLDGEVYVFVDISGSMNAIVTGDKRGKMTCKNVAAMIAASIKRVNPRAHIVPFENRPHFDFRLNSRDSIATNTAKINNAGWGGTNCGACVDHLVNTNAKVDAIIYLSDNESWMDSGRIFYGGGSATATKAAWKTIKTRNRKAKMVCVDLASNQTTQAPDDKSTMNIGGWSDHIFTVMGNFLNGKDGSHWVEVIEEEVSLD